MYVCTQFHLGVVTGVVLGIVLGVVLGVVLARKRQGLAPTVDVGWLFTERLAGEQGWVTWAL